MMKLIEVCFSPVLFKYRKTTDNCIVVIVDVLRATSAFCAAFDRGVKAVIPVSGLDELMGYKHRGFLTAAERDGKKVDFADFGNSPAVFLKSNLNGKELAYSTTNGTQAVETAKSVGNIAVAAFVNLKVISEWLVIQQKDVVILCSGWKNTFSLEDTLCAGALIELLTVTGLYSHHCDAAGAALTLWQTSRNNLVEVVANASHYQRLLMLGLHDDLNYCFRLNSSVAVPVWDGVSFRNVSPDWSC